MHDAVRYPFLTPEAALIFRLTHRSNLDWSLTNGLHARSSPVQDPNFTLIGRFELIAERASRPVRAGPGGDLSDYTPFYFTPSSQMLFNIVTGRAGVAKVPPSDLVVLTASLHDIAAAGIPFVISDRHAGVAYARHDDMLTALADLDWSRLQSRDLQERS